MAALHDCCVVLRGAGDLATGVALRLFRSGFRKLVLLETATPMAVRRTVAFSEAVHDATQTVEGVTASLVTAPSDCQSMWDKGQIPLLVDPHGSSLSELSPHVLIDAIIAKRNLGTRITDAPLVLGLGPGFTAGQDVHCVIETQRGHTLGRVITEGAAIPNTGIPGPVQGYALERVLRAPAAGTVVSPTEIGNMVTKGDIAAYIANGASSIPVPATLSGLVRGMLREGTPVKKGTKLGDIDPRGASVSYLHASEKSLAIGGGVLEAILGHYNCAQPDYSGQSRSPIKSIDSTKSVSVEPVETAQNSPANQPAKAS